MDIKNEMVLTSSLRLNSGQIKGVPKNPRFIRNSEFEKLVKSIREYPEMLQLREVVVYDNVVVMGNMRLRACRELGIKKMSCKHLPHDISSEHIRAYVIKDNISFGQFDMDILYEEWDIPEITDFGLDLKIDMDIPDYGDSDNKEPDNKTDDMFCCPKCNYKWKK